MTVETATPRRRTNWPALVILMAAIAGLVAVFGYQFGKEPSVGDSPLVDKPVPTIEMAPMGGGEPVSLSDFEGQVVIVNFWASWCVPCRDENRHLVSASEDFADQGVVFAGVLFQDSPEAAADFLDIYGWGNPDNYHYLLDDGSRAAIEFGVFGVPETFVVGRDGRVRERIIGGLTAVSLRSAIERAFAA